MKTQINFKSMALGVCIGITAMFVIGAETASNQPGRYQIAVAPGSNPSQAGFAVMVDTQTGKAWGADIQKDFNAHGFWSPK